MNFKKKITISGRSISCDTPCFIIAEAGVNHNGDINLAMEMIEAAKESGADCIKFQTFKTEYIESKYSVKPAYFKNNDMGMSKTEYLKSLEFDRDRFLAIKEHCDKNNIIFLSMASDPFSLRLLTDIGCPAIKISSSNALNYPLFQLIGKLKLPVIYSTGISNFNEIKNAVKYLNSCGVNEMAMLQCTSEYPAPYIDINLRVIQTYKKKFKVPVGLSDHSKGIHVDIAAVAMGASIIEKHFTLDKNLQGVDHKASIEPQELCRMTKQIREIEHAMGSEKKMITDSEYGQIKSMRRSLFSLKKIQKGEKFTLENVLAKRPGEGGISPVNIDKVLGKKAVRDIPEDEFIKWDMVK